MPTITYVAPNRAHHFAYATALYQSTMLYAFVSGVSRFSPHGRPDLGGKFIRRDIIQNAYLISLSLRLPGRISNALAFWSRRHLDHSALPFARESDAFLYYSGAGLTTCKALQHTGVVRIQELVNSHPRSAIPLLEEELKIIGQSRVLLSRQDLTARLEEFEHSDGYICPSTFVKNSLVAQGVPSNRIRVVPFGFTPPPEPPLARSPIAGQFKVLFVGQINFRKGIRYLIEAFERLRCPGKQLRLVGPMAPPTGIEGRQFSNSVQFVGVKRGEALQNEYRNADIFVLATIEEGMALVIAEALSNGLPVITTVNSGAEDLFDHGSAGFILPIRDASSLTDAMQWLVDDPNRLQEMRMQAQLCAKSIRGWQRSGEKLIEALNVLCMPPHVP